MPISIIILILVLITIAAREFFPLHLPIWFIMTLGAIASIATGQISLIDSVKAINFDVILYLFGVFVIAQALECSGYLEQVTERLFRHSSYARQALLGIVIALGFASALLMNDTTAIVGSLIILQLCKNHRSLMPVLLLALAYSVTIGSTVSPIGNPQNLLIAISGPFTSPFTSFFKVLGIPTLINLGILYIVFRLLFRQQMQTTLEKVVIADITCERTALSAKISIILMLILILLKIILDTMHSFMTISFSEIALIAAIPVGLLSRRRKYIFCHLDWGTLLFFISMFILMQSVWDSGFFQAYVQRSNIIINHVPTIFTISSIMSQLISNVPLVALYLPLLHHANAQEYHYLALAIGSTLAGNLFIFGAASNIIIIQNIEYRRGKIFKFWMFSAIGIPLTIINLSVYAIFLNVFR